MKNKAKGNLSNEAQIIEGLLTTTIAIGAWFIIIDFPDKAEKKGFLNHSEAAFIARRIENDRGDAIPDGLTWGKFFKHLLDWKLWTLYVHLDSISSACVPC